MTLIVIETKFTQGAWAVIVAIPLLVLAFHGIRRHYRRVGRRLRAGGPPSRRAARDERGRPLRRVDRRGAARGASGTRAGSPATTSARSTSRARHRPGDPAALAAADRHAAPTSRCCRRARAASSVLEYVWALPRGESQFVTVIVPEQFRRRSLAGRSAGRGVPAQAAAARRAGGRGRRRPASSPGEPRRPPSAPSAASSSPARTPRRCARSTTRETLGSTTRGPSSSHSTRRRPRGCGANGSARRAVPLEIERGAVPRPRRPAAPLPPRAHGRPGDGRGRRHARARLPRLAAAAPQPARALHQAAAPLRAAGDPRQRPYRVG